MDMRISEIKNLVELMGFIPENPEQTLYTKTYKSVGYILKIDFGKKEILYGDDIQRGDETTTNFSHDENFVVLECVNRLLEKSYCPGDLTLEKRWRQDKKTTGIGKSDITITDKSGKTLLVIECKTWGDEYEKQKEKVKQHGGQLFQYFQQDKNARFLCLYASRINANAIEYVSSILKVEDDIEEHLKQQSTAEIITFERARNVMEMLDVWKHKTQGKKTFEDTGIFEDNIEAYNPGFVPTRIKDLKEFEKDDKGRVYNNFEEILRHNNISDRSNAFNRVISLILAKFVDESKTEEQITDFQVKRGLDTPEILQDRLQSLYSKAMKDYLKEEVIDHSLEEIEREISNFPRQMAKENLLRIYKELKYYSNNEFAFKEIYNQRLFEENTKVLEEIVRLFQPFKFKYNRKAQFLGDFFELLLESGYKQSEGQFFTPTPIARFIVSSIPIKEVIQKKLKKGEKNFLPFLIDFACGSGHFLTEAMEEIQSSLNLLDDTKDVFDENARLQLNEYKKDTRWAGVFIYGIEKDYRLARTSQVACFMHGDGDGDANIIFGDGLEKHPHRMRKDGSFDVLIANPPYTIKDFKKHLKVSPLEFDLWNELTEDSDDIEVFFIERMKQLLAVGGMAGIILPSSILSNAGAYTAARELILKYFEIKAIAEMGGNTFGATSTNTVILFLKRRDEDFVKNCEYISDDFYADKRRDNDFVNSQQYFENYVAHIGQNLKDYQSLIARFPNDTLRETEFYKNYRESFFNTTKTKNLKKQDQKVLDRERERLARLTDNDEIQNQKQIIDQLEEDQINQLESLFLDSVLTAEQEKFLYYLLSMREEPALTDFVWEEKITADGAVIPIIKHARKQFTPQTLLVVKSGTTNAEQKAFLGYSFSDRRGYKGIDFSGETKMYDPNDRFNPAKVNGYIYRALNGEKNIVIADEIAGHVSQTLLVGCLDFERVDFDKRINVSSPKNIVIESKFIAQPMSKFVKPINGIIYDSANEITIPSTNKILTASNIDLESGKLVLDKIIYLKDSLVLDENAKLKKNDIFMCTASGSIAHLGKFTFIENDIDYYSGGFCTILRAENPIDAKFVSIMLSVYQEYRNFISRFKGANINNLRVTDLLDFRLPNPPEPVKQQIIAEIESIEKHDEQEIAKIAQINAEIKAKINALYENFAARVKVKPFFDINTKSISPAQIYGETLFTYVDIDSVGKGNGSISFSQKIKGVNAPSRAKRIADDKTVIISTVRPNLKGFAFAEKVPADTVFSTGFALIKSKDEKKYKSKLLYYLFMFSDDLMEQMKAKMPKASYPSINQNDIEGFAIPEIEITAQQDVVTFISKLESEIFEQQRLIQDSESEKQAILRKYLD